MAPDSPSPEHPVFQTPDPAFLQSEENHAEVRDRYLTQDEANLDYPDPSGQADDSSLPLDIDRISQGEGNTSTLNQNESDNLPNHQTGVAFHSGS